MIPIVSIVGKSDSGKTTLIEKLLPELGRRGYRVATVKHDVHGFEVDREGKDSWRHKQAGAHTVIISSPQKVALIRDVEKDSTLDEIRGRWVQDVDLLLSEGYKKDGQPIPMTPFVRDFISKTIKGMLSALRGCETSKRIEIHIEGEKR